jgi:hypothetical protein
MEMQGKVIKVPFQTFLKKQTSNDCTLLMHPNEDISMSVE